MSEMQHPESGESAPSESLAESRATRDAKRHELRKNGWRNRIEWAITTPVVTGAGLLVTDDFETNAFYTAPILLVASASGFIFNLPGPGAWPRIARVGYGKLRDRLDEVGIYL